MHRPPGHVRAERLALRLCTLNNQVYNRVMALQQAIYELPANADAEEGAGPPNGIAPTSHAIRAKSATGVTSDDLPSDNRVSRFATPKLTPEEIGERAMAVASQRYVRNLGTDDRRHQFETLTALLQHIRTIPPDALSILMVRNNTLVAKLGTNHYRPLIADFRTGQDYTGTFDPLDALGVSKSPIAPRVRWDLKSLELNVMRQLQQLPVEFRDGTRKIDTGFFRGRDARDLQGLDLTGMALHDCNLKEADLRGRNFCGGSLPMDIRGADLREAQLYNVVFGKPSRFILDMTINFCSTVDAYKRFEAWKGRTYPDFTDVKMQETKLTMTSPFEDIGGDKRDILDLGYNHLNNQETGSVLKSIHSISDLSLKQTLMKDCIADLMANTNAQDRASIREPLTDILFHDEYIEAASKDSPLRNLIDELIEGSFTDGDTRLLDLGNFKHVDRLVFLDEHLKYAHGHIEHLSLDQAHTAFCQQLIQACCRVDKTEFELRADALKLQQAIYKLPANARAIDAMCQILGYDDSESVDLGGIALFTTGNGDTVTMSGLYYQSFISRITDDEALKNPDMEIQLFDRQGNDKDGEMPSDYITRNAFLRYFLRPAFGTHPLDKILGLDLGPGYTKLFEEARSTARYPGDKLLSSEHKLNLRKITESHFQEQVISETPLIRRMKAMDTYLATVFAEAPLPLSSELERGYYLLFLSAILTNCSSSNHFGQELDSPESLRELAAGLLDSARELFPPGYISDETFIDFEDRLLGNRGAFTCTAIAYSSMREKLHQLKQKNTVLEPIYDMIPATWR